LFYEDLPYAASETEASIHSTVSRVAGARARAFDVALDEDHFHRKLLALGAYPSQLSSQDVALVMAHGKKRGGERLYCVGKRQSVARAAALLDGIARCA
jgi:hypothetical protein